MIEKEYLANRVANANDAQLVAIVYQGLISTLNSAKEHINTENKEELNKSIDKSREILAELLATLQGDSEIANNLRSIYMYVNRSVTEAELKGDITKIDEAIRAINPLYEAWQELGERDEKDIVDGLSSASKKGPAIVAGMTYGKGQLNDYVINDEDRWEKG